MPLLPLELNQFEDDSLMNELIFQKFYIFKNVS